MLRIMKKDEPNVVEVEETKISITQMNNGERMVLAHKLQQIPEDPSGFNELLILVAKHISNIDGVEPGNIESSLLNMVSSKSQNKIIQAVLTTSRLKVDEAKNSQSSPDLLEIKS